MEKLSEDELKIFEEQLESYGVVVHLGDRGYMGDVKTLTNKIRELQKSQDYNENTLEYWKHEAERLRTEIAELREKKYAITMRFGEGKILIAEIQTAGELGVGIGDFEGKRFPIDIPIPEVKGKTWYPTISFIFDKVESINSMIHVLEDHRASKFSPLPQPPEKES